MNRRKLSSLIELEPLRPHHQRQKSNMTSSSNSISSSPEESLDETALVDNGNNNHHQSSSSHPINKLTDFAKTRTGELAAKTMKSNPLTNVTSRAGGVGPNMMSGGVSAVTSDSMCCCSRKCVCVTLIFAFILIDVFLNAFFVTYSFTRAPSFHPYNVRLSLIDIWSVSLARDLVLFVVVLVTAAKHHAIYKFVKFVHRSYLSAFLCLLMYSFAMAKMLLHADQRAQPDQTNMAMLIWNIFAAFGFFISFYMLALLKIRKSSYSKTDIDGGDIGENGGEEDVFIGYYSILFSLGLCQKVSL